MALPPGTCLGAYEIIAFIGAGGMGEVYKARDTRLDRTVAVKVLGRNVPANGSFRTRFTREARTLSHLEHPHICALYDVGRERPRAPRGAGGERDDAATSNAGIEEEIDFLVMQYLEGETLADRLARGLLPLEQALRAATEIAAALDGAHRQGIVHRDLKPGNVMLTSGGVKLLDFGLAKVDHAAATGGSALTTMSARSQAITGQATIVGTFQYMAPEQLEGREVDARTDIFAFGLVLYEMLSGRRAFRGDSRVSLISAILKDQPPPITSIVPLVPPALEHVIRRCLAKDPDGRWRSAHDLGGGSGQGSGRPDRPSTLLMRNVSGVGEERVLFQGKELSPWWYWGPGSVDWSPDGRHVIFSTGQPDTAADLSVLTLDAPVERAVTPFARTAFDELSGLFSPDGKWIAYTSNESGRHEVYVQPFPETGAKVMVSTHGGSQPQWRGDGRELFYLTPDRTLMAVPVKPDSPFSIGTPARLFKAPVADPLLGRNHYVPSWDGRRFLVNVFTPDRNERPRLDVVVNWTAALPETAR